MHRTRTGSRMREKLAICDLSWRKKEMERKRGGGGGGRLTGMGMEKLSNAIGEEKGLRVDRVADCGVHGASVQ